MNDKEIIKKLAEGIKDTYISHHSECCIHCNIYDDDGTFIRDNFGFYHNLNCPVLLAEEILKEENKCSNYNGTGNENKEDGTDNYCTCNHCGGTGTIEPVKGTEPYSEDYLMCNKCDSTFNKEEKKPMKLYELQHYVDKLIAQGYSDVPIYFDTEAKSYDCHIVPIGSINIVPKEAVGEDHIVLYEYIEKPEEPIIVHNVMSYKGKNYLKQLSLQWDPSNIDSCKFCSFNEDCPLIDMACEDNFIWKSFDDIQITDELACMRKDIGDIYLTYTQSDKNKIGLILYSVRGSRLITSNYDDSDPVFNDPEYVRLATAEEIQKYLEDKK